MLWVKRVETILQVLKGSSISEIELTEGELEIVIRRNPGTLVAVQSLRSSVELSVPISTAIEMKSPLTGVYYSFPSPTSEPFIHIGDSIKIGQTIAMIEAMKVFSEVPSEVAGRVVAIKAQNGEVVKKGDVLLAVESV
jgi:acetyl-CoA carboxylase biotin carboxyl carrier protein